MIEKAIYPGTFDPITNGHLHIINRALNLVDHLVIAINQEAGKDRKLLFSFEERYDMVNQIFKDNPKVTLRPISGLLVDLVEKEKAKVIIRGMRRPSDFEYEKRMASLNYSMQKVDTLFLLSSVKYIYTDSSMIREIYSLGGTLEELLQPHVHDALIKKFQKNNEKN